MATVSLLTVLSACTNHWIDWKQPGASDQAQPQTVNIAYYTRDPMFALEEHQGLPIQLHFPLLPGTVFGRPRSSTATILTVRDDHPFVLPTEALSSKIEKVAKPLSETAAATGMAAIPAETAFARVVTYAYTQAGRSRDGLGASAFMRESDQQLLMLMWFAGPMSLTGDTEELGKRWRYELQVPSKGFFWVIDEEQADGSHLLRIVKPPKSLIFAIFPPIQAI